MMNAEGAFFSVADVLEKAGGSFDKAQFLPGIAAYYSRPDGTMLSFPLNSSSPILYYNKAVYRRAELDPELLPPPGRKCGGRHARSSVPALPRAATHRRG